mmetsp:Transcript_24021/g.75237  ORF Transcript_24021/g.75237 Transcript_24021/m.75237 type:complete len:126 (-) Transcript_24021:82-459(-)
MASFSAVKTTVARPAMFTAAKARFAGAPMVAKPMIIKARASRFTVSAAASSEVLGKVQGIIAEQLGTDVEKVGPDAKFVDLGADSLDTVEIMMALEEQFDITLDEEGAEKISTVQEAADMIAAQM